MQTTPKRFGVAAKEPKGSERLQALVTPSLGSAQSQPHRHHVDVSPRRVKMLEELRAGCELIELYDRVSPRFLAGRAQR